MLRFLRLDPNRGVEVGAGAEGALTGHYDIIGDTISGKVGKVPPVRNGTIKVQAWRSRVIAAECEAGPDTGNSEVPFVMPIAGRFTVEELAREHVMLRAINGRGDTGKMIMEGVTRLQLIREYMGPPMEPVFDLHFGVDGGARPFLGRGWSSTEQEFTWMEGNESAVSFESPDPESSYILRLKYNAYQDAFVQPQQLEIIINGCSVAALSEDIPAIQFREFRLNGGCFRGTKNSELVLNHPSAVRPSDLRPDNRDGRHLSFCMRRLGLFRLLPG